MKSIQSKILLVVIVGLFAMTVIISAIGYTATHNILHNDADRLLKRVSEKEAEIINGLLDDIENSVNIMKHYAESELEKPEQLMDVEFRDRYVGKIKGMFKEISRNTIGAESIVFRLSPEYSDYKSGFYLGVVEEGKFLEYDITDFSTYFPANADAVDWYYGAINAGKGIWISPYYDKTAGKNLISFITPFYVDGRLTGVAGLDVDFEYLVDTVNNIAVYDHGYALLISEDKNTIYNSTKQLLDSEYDRDNHVMTRSIKELRNGMKLELRAEYKDIQKDLRPMLNYIVIAFFVVLAVFIVYTIIMTKKLVAPLKQLTAATEKVLTGENVSELPTSSNDEIGTLAKAFSSTYERLKEYTSYINNLAYRDSLTGIKNRTAYAEAVAELEIKIRHDHPKFAVLVADINNLKITNDKFGHDVGNELIIHTSRLLCDTFKYSPVFRIGGDEFVVIIQNKDFENYRSLIEKLDEESAKDCIITGFDDMIPVSLARGVAVYNADIDKVYEDVFNNADHAMYMHKNDYKNAKGQK